MLFISQNPKTYFLTLTPPYQIVNRNSTDYSPFSAESNGKTVRVVFIDWIQIPILIKFRNACILLLMVSNIVIHFILSVLGTSIVAFSVTSYFEHFIKIDWWVLFFSPLIANYLFRFKISK